MTLNVSGSPKVLADFYRQWLASLSRLIASAPSTLRPWRVLLLRTENGLQITANVSNGPLNLGTIDPAKSDRLPPAAERAVRAAAKASSPIVLRLSPEDVVERTVQIPQGASDLITPVLQNQMNRIVPWPIEETCFGFKVEGKNRNAADQLDIRLAATTRAALDKAIAEASDLGIAPTLVDVAPPEEPSIGILLRSLAPDPRLRVARRIHTTLVIFAGLCLAAGSTGFYQYWQAEAENRVLEAKITVQRAQLSETVAEDARTERIRDATSTLTQRRAVEPAVVSLIEELSRALPDNSFLTELEVREGQARITGKSADASALIAVIEAAPRFEQVSFGAPTTRPEGETVETFTITARIAGRAQPEEQDDSAK